jgi:hypothetical protein
MAGVPQTLQIPPPVSIQTMLYNTYLQIIGGGNAPFVGPLDSYATDLRGAFLPFRGFASYTGFGWRVRDTTGGAEQNVSFDAAGNPIAPTVSGSAAITLWNDQSADVRNLANATAGQQPLWTANTINGFPVARFDATNDNLISAATGSATKTFYLVIRRRLSTDLGGKIAAQLGGNDVCRFMGAYGGAWFYSRDADENLIDCGGSENTWSIISLVYRSGDAQVYVNNATTGSFTPADIPSNARIQVGFSTSPLDIDAAAALVYSAEHNDTTRQAIQTILANKLGITL